MPKALSNDPLHTKRLALMKRREEQQADAPKAMAEYRAKQRAAIERMHQLRALRLAREAEAAKSKRRSGSASPEPGAQAQ
jgi:hypothetical protein